MKNIGTTIACLLVLLTGSIAWGQPAQVSTLVLSVDRLADEVALSKRQLQLKLQALTGLSSAGYIRTMRLQRAAQLLAQGGITVAEAAYAVGFQKVPHFSKLFRQVFGVTPSKYIEKEA